jgi:hypothetical protein
MRSIVRRDTGESYEEFLSGLARTSGMATPTRKQLARLDRKRKKRTSNKEWMSPTHTDARVTKMKDGRTHLAHKVEHAVDLDTGAVGGGDPSGSRQGRHDHVGPYAVRGRRSGGQLVGREAQRYPNSPPKVNVAGIEEMVADRGIARARLSSGLGVMGYAVTFRNGSRRGSRIGRATPASSRRCTPIGDGCRATTANAD